MSRYLSSTEHTSITHAWICLNINLLIHPPSFPTLSVSPSLPLRTTSHLPLICILSFSSFFRPLHPSLHPNPFSTARHLRFQDQWLARGPMLQRRVYHVMAAVRRQLYVLGGNDLDYNNDRILVRHIDSYNMDLDQWTRCSFSLLTGGQSGETAHVTVHTVPNVFSNHTCEHAQTFTLIL